MGGLANRMRAISVCYDWAKDAGVELVVEWAKTWDMGARWRDLFEYPEGITIREIGDGDKYPHFFQFKRWYRNFPHRLWAWLHDYVWLPYNVMEVLDDIKTDEDIIRVHDYFVNRLKSGERLYIVTGDYLGEYSDLSMFCPIASVQSQIDAFLSTLDSRLSTLPSPLSPLYGLHIRRTDNTWAIAGSPIEAFETKIREILVAEPDARFYLASDDKDTIERLRSLFGDAISVRKKTYGRTSVSGIQDAIVDLWLLSRTKKIFGSVGSSFGGMAAKLGGITCESVCK